MNLCRCGNTGNTSGAACTCTELSRRSYLQRVSGAIIDRFDIRVRLRLTGSILDGRPGPESARVRARVAAARTRQRERWGGRLNGEVTTSSDARFALEPRAREQVLAFARGAEGGRVQRAIVRLARTVADLDERETITREDVITAHELCRTTPGGTRA
jgi:magnesium chelatase family protein